MDGDGARAAAEDTITLTLVCACAAAAGASSLSVEQRVPRTLTLARLKQLCARHFGVPAARVALRVRRPGAPDAEQPLDVGSCSRLLRGATQSEKRRDLYWLGVADGDTILVDEDTSVDAGES